MVGFGTLLNMVGIIAGGGLGLTIGNRISEAYRQMVMVACGICLIFIGAAGVLAEMLVFKDGRLGIDRGCNLARLHVCRQFFGRID